MAMRLRLRWLRFKFSHHLNRLDPAGISLVEVMIGTGLMGVLALGMGEYMSGFTGQLTANKTRNLRMEIAERVRRVASNDASLRYSAFVGTGNIDFKPCISQNIPTAISACQATTNYLPLFLYDVSDGKPQPDPTNPAVCNSGTPQPVGVCKTLPKTDYLSGASAGSSGQPATPRRYRPDGSPCPLGVGPSRECPIEVTTEFRVKQGCS